MKEHLKKAISHPLISGSAVIVIGSTVGNVFNYLFNLSMGRLLSIAEYGVLVALISLFNVFLVFSNSILTVFSKFSAAYAGKEKEELIGELFKKGIYYVGIVSGIISLLIIVSAGFIGRFLHISNVLLIVLIAVSLFLNALYSVEAGILQGVLRLVVYTVTYIVGAFSKFFISILLVFMGFHVLGAIMGILLSAVVFILATFIPLTRYLYKKVNEPSLHLHKQLILFAVPVLLCNIGIILATSVDILLVKHFFNDTASGQYGALSLMGRTIFFVVQPIAFVFFPILVQKKEKGESLKETLMLSSAIVGIPCVLAIFLYFHNPALILRIFFPALGYRMLAPYLGPFSIFIFLYALSYFGINFFLSIGKTRVFILSLLASFFEILLISLFHHDFFQIINVLTLTYFLLLISLLLYFFLSKKE